MQSTLNYPVSKHIHPSVDVNFFDLLPIETTQEIALSLESDSDVANFRGVCRSTRNAVDADACSFWRRRFLMTFEKPGWKPSGGRMQDNQRYRDVYKRRQVTLKRGAEFSMGNCSSEQRCLQVLLDLILESFSEKKKDDDGRVYESKNLTRIIRFIEANNLHTFFNPPRVKRAAWAQQITKHSQLLLMVQSLLAPSILSLDLKGLSSRVYSFRDSQRAVYGHAIEQPIFAGVNGREVNMEWMVHQLNFWKYHLVNEEEHTLFHAFSALESCDRPRYWSTQLTNDTPTLGRSWKGAYSFVERDIIGAVRATSPGKVFQDEFNGESQADAFQDLELAFVERNEETWPVLFEQHLKSLQQPVARVKTRAQRRRIDAAGVEDVRPRSFRFDGEGSESHEQFCASGWLNALPNQYGVPGWQRMTMMKYFEDEDTGLMDTEALWAYEGMVLPGGRIMLGRWWSPNDGECEDMYSGPFILWCIDSSCG